MTYVITRSCCNDASCVAVCPVNCIHPTPEEPDYRTAEMLYIDPAACIECGACMDVCPVSAIHPDYELPDHLAGYEAINAAYYDAPGATDYPQVANAPATRTWDGPEVGTVRVAIVGSGPSACYTAQELLDTKGIDLRVDMFERLPTPFGLVRYGVAPDHQDTKVVTEGFTSLLRRKGFRIFLNTEVGKDVAVAQLVEHYDAVIYAVGALDDRRMGVSGEDLPGSHAATEFVAWYNGHPDFADRTFDLDCERAVVVGNGNVALDVARLLAAPVDVLERSDITEHALDALRSSRIREVVVIGRRGPAEAAFTTPELLGLSATPGVRIRVDGADPSAFNGDSFAAELKLSTLTGVASTGDDDGDRTVTFRFLAGPSEILGDSHVSGIRVNRNALIERDGRQVAEPTGETEVIDCGLVLRSVGYRGAPVPDVPFDDVRGTIPHESGRVIDTPGAYVVGWIKRGPSGVIGTNRHDAKETVETLLGDLASGALVTRDTRPDIAADLPHALDASAWRTLDRAERTAGREAGRPRLKLFRVEDMLRKVRDAA